MPFLLCVLKLRRLTWGKENNIFRHKDEGNERPLLSNTLVSKPSSVRLHIILGGKVGKERNHLISMSLITVDLANMFLLRDLH